MGDEGKKSAPRTAEKSGDALIGTVLGGRYRLDVLLGSGSMGRVYRAEHVLMHKPVAVKVMNREHTKSAELVARFEREATAAANIEHPNVVAATDFGKLDDGTVYLALELVEGKNLRAEIAEGALDVRRALHIARQIAAGLAAAHAKNIVHRDLKPENVVLVEKDGDPDFAKILDFGVAKLAPETGKSPLTKVGVVLGTLDYMAPEQALGQPVDHRADLYALGVVTYEMLTGKCPYEGESSAAIVGLQMTKRPPSLRERLPTLTVPGAVEALVMKLLSKDRNERPASAAAVVAELDRLVKAAPSGVGPPRPAASPAKRPPGAPAPAVQHKPTFLPTDPLPAFTFPPLEEASKKLAEEVKQAVAARPPVVSSSPSVDALLASPAPAAKPAFAPITSPVSSSPAVDALLANVVPASASPPGPPLAAPGASSGNEPPAGATGAPKADVLGDFRARAWRIIDAAIVWVDDQRRFLPRFIKRPLRRIPSGALLAGLAVFVVVLLVLVVVLLASGSEEPAEATPARASSAAAPVASAPAVASDSSSDEASQKAIARAETELKAGNWAGVTVAIKEALSSSPLVKQNDRVATMLGDAARHEASSSSAFALLSGSMGGKGAEVLYELAASPKTPSDVRTKAEALIVSDAFERVASPALAIAAKLRTTRGCREKKSLFGAAEKSGDRRALEYLRSISVKGGCGRRGRDDCYPCLREDEKLGETIAKLEARLGSK
jgi:serine/threonine-protein kinase